jgi:hypothetical protein
MDWRYGGGVITINPRNLSKTALPVRSEAVTHRFKEYSVDDNLMFIREFFEKQGMEKKKITICLVCVVASLAMCLAVGAEETGGVGANAANSTPPGRLVVSILWFENRAGSEAEHWSHALEGSLWNQIGQVKAIRTRGGVGYARRKLSIVEGSALNADQPRKIGDPHSQTTV